VDWTVESAMRQREGAHCPTSDRRSARDCRGPADEERINPVKPGVFEMALIPVRYSQAARNTRRIRCATPDAPCPVFTRRAPGIPRRAHARSRRIPAGTPRSPQPDDVARPRQLDVVEQLDPPGRRVMTTMRSASVIASDKSWVTKTTVCWRVPTAQAARRAG